MCILYPLRSGFFSMHKENLITGKAEAYMYDDAQLLSYHCQSVFIRYFYVMFCFCFNSVCVFTMIIIVVIEYGWVQNDVIETSSARFCK